jgi:hypothetical protein
VNRVYKTATAFRRSLENRLMNIAQKSKIDLQRLRRKVAFDRLLARLFMQNESNWILKGGYALEVRFAHARSTKDLDLTIPLQQFLRQCEEDDLIGMLQRSSEKKLGDYFVFSFFSSMQELDGAPEGGFRFPVEATVDGRVFVKFHIDIGMGDVLVEPTEKIIGEDWLGFAGIAPATMYAISKEQQFAEKLHAYTLPRKDRPNTRVKDLVDMLLLIREGNVNIAGINESLHKIFQRRNTHQLPTILPQPPDGWDMKFDFLVKECGIKETVSEAIKIVDHFYQKAIHHDDLKR